MSVTAFHSLRMSSTITASCSNTWHSRSACLHAHEGNEIWKWRMYDVNWYLQYNVYCIPYMNISIALREQDQSLPNRYYLNKVHFDLKSTKLTWKSKSCCSVLRGGAEKLGRVRGDNISISNDNRGAWLYSRVDLCMLDWRCICFMWCHLFWGVNTHRIDL